MIQHVKAAFFGNKTSIRGLSRRQALLTFDLGLAILSGMSQVEVPIKEAAKLDLQERLQSDFGVRVSIRSLKRW